MTSPANGMEVEAYRQTKMTNKLQPSLHIDHEKRGLSMQQSMAVIISPKRKSKNCGRTKDKSNLSVIARHRKLGEASLNMLKNEVRAYAVDHTYKGMIL